MSRVGKMPIVVPAGVTVSVDNGLIKVAGSKGSQELPLPTGIILEASEGSVEIKRANDEAELRAKHGLIRALVANMVAGVSQGFEKKLEINGVGYRVQAQGADLKFNLGFSHDIIYKIPAGVEASIDQNIITLTGVNKQQVGQAAAEIRSLKKPEPYKGKGIKYADERILRKSGKSGKE